MKKTLLILLALLAATTITLSACSDSGKVPVDNGDENDDIENVDESTDEDTDEDTDDETDDETQGNTSGDGYVDKNDTVYAGVSLRLRTSPSTASDNNIAKVVDFGTKLNRVSSNGVWDKVTLDGSDTVYYVDSDWVAAGNANFVFTNCETPVEITLSTTTSNKVVFFQSPFECEDNNKYFANAVCASGLSASNLSEGYKLTKVATNANWIKVTFVGTVTISSNNSKTFTEEAPATLYIKARAFERGDVVDPTYSSGGSGVGGIG